MWAYSWLILYSYILGLSYPVSLGYRFPPIGKDMWVVQANELWVEMLHMLNCSWEALLEYLLLFKYLRRKPYTKKTKLQDRSSLGHKYLRRVSHTSYSDLLVLIWQSCSLHAPHQPVNGYLLHMNEGKSEPWVKGRPNVSLIIWSTVSHSQHIFRTTMIQLPSLPLANTMLVLCWSWKPLLYISFISRSVVHLTPGPRARLLWNALTRLPCSLLSSWIWSVGGCCLNEPKICLCISLQVVYTFTQAETHLLKSPQVTNSVFSYLVFFFLNNPNKQNFIYLDSDCFASPRKSHPTSAGHW